MRVTTTMSMRSGKQNGGSENGPEKQNERSENDIGISSPLALEQLRQQGLLRVQPVFGLLEGERAGTIQHVVRDLLGPVRGQAVHHNRMVRCLRQERRVDSIRVENPSAGGGGRLLSHA